MDQAVSIANNKKASGIVGLMRSKMPPRFFPPRNDDDPTLGKNP